MNFRGVLGPFRSLEGGRRVVAVLTPPQAANSGAPNLSQSAKEHSLAPVAIEGEKETYSTTSLLRLCSPLSLGRVSICCSKVMIRERGSSILLPKGTVTSRDGFVREERELRVMKREGTLHSEQIADNATLRGPNPHAVESLSAET